MGSVTILVVYLAAERRSKLEMREVATPGSLSGSN